MTALPAHHLSRRGFLAAGAAACSAALVRGEAPQRRPKIAAVTTIYFKISHAQHIVDRFLEGYAWQGRHHRPPMDLVSLYVDQVGGDDLSRERAKRLPQFKTYPTIAETLTLGSDKLAVDGVLLIGEHGNYPQNEKGQRLYPRYEFFRQTVDVFRASGRSVSVFNDKHLSWKWEWAKEMVDTSRAMGFPLMAGSSLPLTWRIPSVDLPWEAEVDEALCVAMGGVDSYDFHALETIQCMVERRRGGETGVAAVQALRGEKVWQALRAGSWAAGGWDGELFQACLCRSPTLQSSAPGRAPFPPQLDALPRMVGDPVAYRIEYRDGLKATMLLLNGLVGDFTFAARLKGQKEPLSTLFWLPPPESADFFNPLVHQIETMFSSGKAPQPIERTLLTTGLVAAGVESLAQSQTRVETPHLAIRYMSPRESAFVRS